MHAYICIYTHTHLVYTHTVRYVIQIHSLNLKMTLKIPKQLRGSRGTKAETLLDLDLVMVML